VKALAALPAPPMPVTGTSPPDANAEGPPAVPEVKTDSPGRSQDDILTDWLAREDEDDDLFLSKFNNFTLDSWDHYTHLRIAYIYLSRYERRDAMKHIFDGIKKFIENSPRTIKSRLDKDGKSRGTTFHETMTYFWIHMIHYAMVATKLPDLPSALSTAGKMNRWKTFLLMNPQLSNGGLFLFYYRKETILLSEESRKQVVLPDLQPLPSLISSIESNTTAAAIIGSNSSETTGLMKPLVKLSEISDMTFLDLVENYRLPSHGHEVKLRLLYVLLVYKYGRSSSNIDRIFNYLKEYLERGENAFHLTLNYFWIQMIHYSTSLLLQNKTKTKEAFGKLYIPATGSESDTAVVIGEEGTEKICSFQEFIAYPSSQDLLNQLLHER
jgi:hypothetical protein